MTKASKYMILAAILMMLIPSAWADDKPQKYSMVEISVETQNAKQYMDVLSHMGLAIDCCARKEVKNRDGEVSHVVFEVPVNEQELQMLQEQRSIEFNVVIDDMAKHYEKHLASITPEIIAAAQPRDTEWKLGSMAGAYKLNEYLDTMDQLYAKYASTGLISKKVSIGKTHQGRDIYMIKISDNANQEENEPGVLITALHHARESASIMTVTYYMFHLLENYNTDSRVKNIVDGREMYFVPMLNVDSYYYNERTNPNGGGMVRKNQNGVDLNRNYGPQNYWNYPNSGSSTSPWSETYRGTAPFSEPETRAVRDFLGGRKNIRTCLNFHTYSNLLIYPLGIKDQIAHSYYRDMAVRMTKKNNYRYGTAEYLLYAVRGVSDDYMHVEGVFAMTPEVGSSGFWPGPSQMRRLAEENLEMCLQVSEEAAKVPNLRK